MRIFQAESGYFFLSKVCSKIFKQGPVEKFSSGFDCIVEGMLTSDGKHRIHFSGRVWLLFFKQGLLKNFHAGSD